MGRRIELLTFDLDNTLWAVDPIILGAEAALRDWLQIQTPDVVERFQGESLRALREQVVKHRPELVHDVSRLREEVMFAAMRRCGYETAEARRLAREAFQVFLDARHQVEFFPGALELLDRLAGSYRLAALTNGNADIRRLGLDRYFDFAHNAASAGASKPAPAMFQAALRDAGCTPEGAIHLGDHIEHDVAGARAVGMHAIWVNLQDDATPAQRHMPSAVVTTLTAVPAAVAAIDGYIDGNIDG